MPTKRKMLKNPADGDVKQQYNGLNLASQNLQICIHLKKKLWVASLLP